MITRYVNTASSAGGNGTTNATTGANRAYASLNEWEAARIVGTLADVEEVICEGSAADTTMVTVSGTTTSAANYILIRTDPAGRHDGKWNTSAYRLTPSAGFTAALILTEDHVRVQGLQIENTSTDSFSEGVSWSGAGDLYVEKNIIRNVGAGTDKKGVDVSDSSATTAVARIYNNIIYGFNGADAHAYFDDYGPVLSHVYNNTVHGNTTGIYVGNFHANEQCNLKNNLCNGNTTDYNVNAEELISSNNISEDATSPDTAYRNKAVTFVDETGKDFHLDGGDTNAKDAGADLSGEFTDDIDYDTRSGTWDIGADEDVGGGEVTGTLAQTLAALVLAATATVAIAGSATPTLGALTSSATATVEVQGSSAPTLAALALSAAGIVGDAPIEGTLDQTLDAVTISAVGTAHVQGTTAVTLAALAPTAAGVVDIAGVAAPTLGALTAPGAAGTVAISGTATPTLGVLTSSAAGSIPIDGSTTATLGSITIDAQGVVGEAPIEGSLAQTLGAVTVGATATAEVRGQASAMLAALTGSGSATAEVRGTTSATLGTVSVSGAGTVAVAGSSAGLLAPLVTSGALGAVEVRGALAQTLDTLSTITESSYQPTARPGDVFSTLLVSSGHTTVLVGSSFTTVLREV